MTTDPRLPSPGERMVYFTGDLATSRTTSRDLNALADALWAASERGEVVLTQERSLGGTLYYATGVQRLRALVRV